jgi:hypothetical protein
MQEAINTFYLKPTQSRCARVKAQCAKKSRIYSWDHELDAEENHLYAAEKLAQELGWWDSGTWVAGCLKDGSYAHCCLVVPSFDPMAYITPL